MKNGLKEAVYLFNHGHYFEAHEVLEDIWRECPSEDKAFFQGLVQLAVALHHNSTGNTTGALSVLARAEENLKGFPETFHNIDVKMLRVSVPDWRSSIQSAQRLSGPHIELIV